MPRQMTVTALAAISLGLAVSGVAVASPADTGATGMVSIAYASGSHHTKGSASQRLTFQTKDVGGGRIKLSFIIGEPAGHFSAKETAPRVSLALSVVCPPATTELQTAHFAHAITRFYPLTKSSRLGILPAYAHTFALCPGTPANMAVFHVAAKITSKGKTLLAVRGDTNS
ncbi:MAG: hypothetical protein ABI317_11240 [Gaiellales bacterium]